MGVGSERYFPIRLGPRCGGHRGLLCRDVRLLDPPPETASKCGRLQNPVRACAQHRRCRNRSGADNWAEAAGASPDVRHRTGWDSKLAVGEAAPPRTSGQGKSDRAGSLTLL